MTKINAWHIEDGYTATFGPTDFESWWLAGMTRDDKIKKQDRSELYENCIYIAEAEQREMTQSASELKSAINNWADEWNKKINVSVAAAALGSIKSPKKAASSRENGKKGGRPKKFHSEQHDDELFNRVCINALNGIDVKSLSKTDFLTHQKWVEDNWDDLNAE